MTGNVVVASGSRALLSNNVRIRILRMMTLLSLAGFLLSLYMAVGYAGTDTMQGDVQRLFYMHLPSFGGAFVGFSLAVVGGFLYLATRQTRWDALAVSAVEVGFALALINLALGSIWARPTWNTWWTGDSRMTASLVMTLLCAAYLMLRKGVENPERRRLVSAFLGVLLMGAMVFTILVTRVRADTIHPVVIGASPQDTTQGGFAMTSSMRTALIVNLVVWMGLLAPTLIWWRIRLENLSEKVTHFRKQS